jgi:phage portal protein BeeE
MSWITPIVREVMADKAATDHKLSFFENGATPNLVVKLDVQDLERFKGWVEEFKDQHEGAVNAYRTIFLGAGADATTVGANLQQLEFKATQGAGETRIAAAAGVPPVIVGLSEGLQAATYSNYGQARRRFADGTMRPLWRNMAGSLARIIDVPPRAELWYDDRDIPFLQEDQKDAAEVSSMKATAMKTLVDAGYNPDSVVAAVDSGDLTLLQHSGLVSVQLQPPGAEPAPVEPAPVVNGSKGTE